jgi:hypothetical protein
MISDWSHELVEKNDIINEVIAGLEAKVEFGKASHQSGKVGEIHGTQL